MDTQEKLDRARIYMCLMCSNGAEEYPPRLFAKERWGKEVADRLFPGPEFDDNIYGVVLGPGIDDGAEP